MGRKGLGEFETAVLLAIIRLRGRGYGVSIADEIERSRGELGDPTPERGGKPKRFYRIKAPGERALREAQAIAERIWAGVPPIEATA